MEAYIINEDHSTEPTDDTSKSFESKEKYGRVGDTTIGEARVSTVFLAVDHSFEGAPLLFETMIFGGERDQYMERYGSWDEAVKGHEYACKLVRDSQGAKEIK